MQQYTLDQKLDRLKDILQGYGQMLVALSGGVDSVFLLTFAHRLWRDDRVAALTAEGPHFAPDEVEYAKALCEALGISHKTIRVDDILPLIADNPRNRCYICKREIFSRLMVRAEMTGSVLADGTNADDMQDDRPGYRALCELGVASPLKEADLTKEEIRQALQGLAAEDEVLTRALQWEGAFPLWEKPAFACLASRIPYGEKITEEKLEAIYRAEGFLRGLGFSQVRVRHHGHVARIEVPLEDRRRFWCDAFMDRVNEGIRACGFLFAALDLGGYKMGNLNQQKILSPDGDEQRDTSQRGDQ